METKNLETAMVGAIEHLASKKLGGVIVIALLLSSKDAPPWMLFGLALGYLVAQVGLDAWQRYLASEEPVNPTVARAEP